MEKVYVYSKSPIKNDADISGIKLEETKINERYCCTIYSESSDDVAVSREALDFIFYSLIQKIVCKTLKINYTPEANNDDSEALRISCVFSQKLAEYLCTTGNKVKIDKIIKRLLKNSQIIDLDGIIAFRLREFSQDIFAFFDKLFYEYKIQKQYDEFVLLISGYIESERPKEKEIHLIFKNNSFILLNSEHDDITEKALKTYKRDSNKNERNRNDFLISSLLDYMPSKIILHVESGKANSIDWVMNKKIIDTITAVFKERVENCSNNPYCNYCMPGAISFSQNKEEQYKG